MKMKKLLKVGAIAVMLTLFGSANVYAADKGPTVSDAHELIGDLVGKGLLFHDGVGGKYKSYQGVGCASSLHMISTFGEKDQTMQIDWSTISSAERDDSRTDLFIEKFHGLVTFTNLNEKPSTQEWSHFIVIDEVTRKRVDKAVNLLIKSCNKAASKFD